MLYICLTWQHYISVFVKKKKWKKWSNIISLIKPLIVCMEYIDIAALLVDFRKHTVLLSLFHKVVQLLRMSPHLCSQYHVFSHQLLLVKGSRSFSSVTLTVLWSRSLWSQNSHIQQTASWSQLIEQSNQILYLYFPAIGWKAEHLNIFIYCRDKKWRQILTFQKLKPKYIWGSSLKNYY